MSRLGIALSIILAAMSGPALAATVVVMGEAVSGGQPAKQTPLGLFRVAKPRNPKKALKEGSTDTGGSYTLTANAVISEDDMVFVVALQPNVSEPIGMPLKVSGPVLVGHPPEKVVVVPCEHPEKLSALEAARCVAAIHNTERVMVWAGFETAETADKAFQARVKRFLPALAGLDAHQRKEFSAGLERPLAGVSVPMLASARGSDFLPAPQDMMASSDRYCVPNIPKPLGDADVYRGRDGRCEGRVAQLAGAKTEVVSVTEGSFSFDPSLAAIDFRWTPDAGGSVCLTASPSAPGVFWRMDVEMPPRQERFRWSLNEARKGKVPPASMGVVVRSCGATDAPLYRPVRVGSVTSGQRLPYEVVVVSDQKLFRAYLTITEKGPSKPEAVIEERHPIPFKVDDPRPRIPFPVPRSSSGPGVYTVKLELIPEAAGSDFEKYPTMIFSLSHD